MRLDKWLWAARFYKTRQIAIGEINKGRILVNEDKPKPARMLKTGDNLTIKRGFDVYNVTVLLLLPTRCSATIAQTMYEESIENQNIRIEAAYQRSLNVVPRPESKPNKHDRQMLRDIRQSF